MLTKQNIDYFNNQKFENKKFWKRLGGKPNFENKKVLDFGCGHGPALADILFNNGFHMDLYDPFFFPNKKVFRN